jgi:RNA polymerase sigma-70 factor (ECF subfamily)
MFAPLPDENASISYPQLLDQARSLDRNAFARLYEATYRRVFGYLLARMGDRGEAEDLLQDVYLTALQAIRRFRGRTEGEFIGWILKIANGKVVDRLRYRYRHPEHRTGDSPSDRPSADPLDAIDERAGLRQISEALAQLTQEERDVVINRLVLGFDLEETSKILDKNVGSIKALQHRALARLAKILAKEGDDNA